MFKELESREECIKVTDGEAKREHCPRSWRKKMPPAGKTIIWVICAGGPGRMEMEVAHGTPED
jgi:hypothetical protein